jgi:SOS response regulatory protein OraA/RecX
MKRSDEPPTLLTVIEKLGPYLGMRSHSIAETKRHLQQKQQHWLLTDTLLEQVLQYLIDEKVLDDELFAKQRAHQMTAKGKGVISITFDLRAKGVPANIIERVCASCSQEDQQESAVEMLSKWQKRSVSKLEKLPKLQQMQKGYQYLAQRGFSSSVIRNAVDAFFTDITHIS